jgi:hypothetical protein
VPWRSSSCRQRSLAILIDCGGFTPMFYVGRHLARVGEADRALPLIRRAFEAGYFCYPVMAEDSWLDRLRSHEEFERILAAARVRWERARIAFTVAGGDALLAN